ncbi:MAG: aminopeptidase [Bacteroidales bacterium]|nr:aminopeptidase [Bacteroidales bacterium]MBQ2483030.1 aminopeptidase [Bacteroidales bacterium]MBQ4197610.1 aminopeptidase [Bacteroidales bacterium]
MKRLFIAAAALFLGTGLFAQELQTKFPHYEFTIVKNLPATAVKNQAATGTCWCFATTSFLESEAIRKGTADTDLDLSEMYTVRQEYLRRGADYYYRRGKGRRGPGGISHQATYWMERAGLMPDEAYNGINYDSKTHNHNKLQKEIDDLLDTAVAHKQGVPYDQMNEILDKYLGKVPATFTYKGKEYDPISFKEHLELEEDDYVEITSFTHHPYYGKFILEIPDNWDMAASYNVTLDELDAICTRAVMHGYTVAWDADMSEIYFAHNNHLAVFAPGENIRGAKKIEKYYTESPIDADIRQAMWNDFTTSDDHLMHITGIAKDQNGVKYYIVKNSWGPDNGDGYLYVSESYFKAKTIQIMVAKDALTKGIKKKLDIK